MVLSTDWDIPHQPRFFIADLAALWIASVLRHAAPAPCSSAPCRSDSPEEAWLRHMSDLRQDEDGNPAVPVRRQPSVTCQAQGGTPT